MDSSITNGVKLILLLPFLGFLWCAAFGRAWPRLSGWVASIAIGTAFIFAISVFLNLLGAPEPYVRVGQLNTWITSGTISIPFDIYLDPLTTIMLLVVTGVSFLIHVYATAY